jgi:hypothetical protein
MSRFGMAWHLCPLQSGYRPRDAGVTSGFGTTKSFGVVSGGIEDLWTADLITILKSTFESTVSVASFAVTGT